MVFAIRNSTDYRSLADWLESTQSASSLTAIPALSSGPQLPAVTAIPALSSDYHTWPEQWAVDSVQQAGRAYQNVQFGVATIDKQRLRITIQLPGYIETNQAIAAEQLAKAGFHLANLLDTIQWH